MWHQGTVIIEDVHRLAPDARMQVIDYLKFLADTEPIDRKLVLIGIPNSGSALVEESFDLATRIDVYEPGKVSTQLVLSMIEKGENALHLEFDQKTEIAVAAGGSLNVAQSLCFRVCQNAQIVKTLDKRTLVECDLERATAAVFADMAREFSEPIRQFAALGDPQESVCIRLLDELRQAENGVISLRPLRDRRPELANGMIAY
jgi:hypothetical protein